jgi:DNA-binding NtrC family response regulator
MTTTRNEAQNKLEFFIKNPGYFSILILGDSGTGKSFIINTILSGLENPKFGFYYPYEIGENSTEISKIFEKEFIIIKNIEELSMNQQNILFKTLSTSNGEIGLNDNIGLKRIIFTSSYDVIQLRESRKYLLDRFWDRISQLVVKVPSFKDFSADIRNDFKSVWEKMDFKEFPKLPVDIDFNDWLTENCKNFSGNFRDLDSIAILWHQYRIIEYGNANQKFKSDIEARIFRKVRADFEGFTHFPTQKTDSSNVFEFEKGKTWEQIERNFHSKFKNWAKNEYDTIKSATEELNMPLRKMDKW